MVRSVTISRVLIKGLYKLKNKNGVELKTSYNSSRLKIYHHSDKSQEQPTKDNVKQPISVTQGMGVKPRVRAKNNLPSNFLFGTLISETKVSFSIFVSLCKIIRKK